MHATVIRKSKKARARARMIKELDNEARQAVFERDGHVCVRCRDKSRAVTWAHIFSRRHKNLRWTLDNALSLCAGCHMFWHHEPILATDWFRKNWPERYSRLIAVNQLNTKVNVKELWESRSG